MEEILSEVVEEEDLDEITVTGDVAGYETPMAFTGGNGKKKKKKIATNSTGYDLVKEAIDEKDIKIIKKAIRSSDITGSVNMKNALVEYVQLMHNGYATLTKGVNAYIDAVESGLLAKGVTDISQLESVRKRLMEKLLKA